MNRACAGVALVLSACVMAALPRAGAGQHEPPRRWASWLPLAVPPAPHVHFRAGAFAMGSTPEAVLAALTQCADEPLSQHCPDFSDEQPVRLVQLSAFALDTTEVSVGRYQRCVEARRCAPIPFYRGARRFEQPNYPATFVRHADAMDYCNFAGGDLPTEAQYERAAGGVGKRAYPWGNRYHSQAANHGRLAFVRSNGADGTVELAPVTAYPQGATVQGVLNLAGNAAEWMSDRYLPYYVDNDTIDPQGPGADSGSSQRVVRGGGYLSPRVMLRATARDAARADARSADRGFRCAYSAYATIPR